MLRRAALCCAAALLSPREHGRTAVCSRHAPRPTSYTPALQKPRFGWSDDEYRCCTITHTHTCVGKYCRMLLRSSCRWRPGYLNTAPRMLGLGGGPSWVMPPPAVVLCACVPGLCLVRHANTYRMAIENWSQTEEEDPRLAEGKKGRPPPPPQVQRCIRGAHGMSHA